MRASARLFHTVVVVGAAMTAPTCGGTVEISTSPGASGHGGAAMGGSGQGGESEGAGGAGGVGGHPVVCAPVPCNQTGMVVACGDCVDNDGDGKIDADDPECVNACGSDEACPMVPCGSVQPCGLACLPPCAPGSYCLSGCCLSIA